LSERDDAENPVGITVRATGEEQLALELLVVFTGVFFETIREVGGRLGVLLEEGIDGKLTGLAAGGTEEIAVDVIGDAAASI
jgi:hypothetical protein